MELFIRSFILSVMIGISSKEYFEVLLPRRPMKFRWMEQTAVFGFILGFLAISVTPVPPYFLQPARVIIVLWLVALLYFRSKPLHTLVLSVFLCGVMWILIMITETLLFFLPVRRQMIPTLGDPIWCSALLGGMLVFSSRFKGKAKLPEGSGWLWSGLFPLFSMSVLIVVSLMIWEGEVLGDGIKALIVSGLGVTNILAYYFIGSILRREAELQSMNLEKEHIRSQMDSYRRMEESYRQQKQLMHDYKNQLNCIQGLLENGCQEEALAYTEKLTGNIKKSMDFVDTNHSIVNIILNQKYQYAQQKGITMVISVNDLSRLSMDEQDIVVLLSNLIDNAVEACEKLDADKVIWFKMVIEEDQLILSVKNPVRDPVTIKGKKADTTKKDKQKHGIGLSNVEAVVKKMNGTSVLKYADHSFCFSMMAPAVKS